MSTALATFTWSKRYVVAALGRSSSRVYFAHRACELARRLRKRGHRAQVVYLPRSAWSGAAQDPGYSGFRAR